MEGCGHAFALIHDALQCMLMLRSCLLFSDPPDGSTHAAYLHAVTLPALLGLSPSVCAQPGPAQYAAW